MVLGKCSARNSLLYFPFSDSNNRHVSFQFFNWHPANDWGCEVECGSNPRHKTSAYVRKSIFLQAMADQRTAPVPKMPRSIQRCPKPHSAYCSQHVYLHKHISDTVQNVYELHLLPHNTAVKQFYTIWER